MIPNFEVVCSVFPDVRIRHRPIKYPDEKAGLRRGVASRNLALASKAQTAYKPPCQQRCENAPGRTEQGRGIPRPFVFVCGSAPARDSRFEPTNPVQTGGDNHSASKTL